MALLSNLTLKTLSSNKMHPSMSRVSRMGTPWPWNLHVGYGSLKIIGNGTVW